MQIKNLLKSVLLLFGAMLGVISCQPFHLNKNNHGAGGPDRFGVPGSVKLAWEASKDPETGAPDSRVVGYYIYYHKAGEVYGSRVDVGNVLTAEVKGLITGNEYYFVATAYSADKESAFSNEVHGLPTESKVLDSSKKTPMSKVAEVDKETTTSQNITIDMQACAQAKGYYLYYGVDADHLTHRMELGPKTNRFRVLGLKPDQKYSFLLVPLTEDKKVLAEAKIKSVEQSSPAISAINDKLATPPTLPLKAVCE